MVDTRDRSVTTVASQDTTAKSCITRKDPRSTDMNHFFVGCVESIEQGGSEDDTIRIEGHSMKHRGRMLQIGMTEGWTDREGSIFHTEWEPNKNPKDIMT